ncbi:MAG TPA: hypothetical protein VLD58_17030 [Gemmatimonadales bacterium]|nr:hypothetical protein [Gemmatimonadales bacterium]
MDELEPLRHDAIRALSEAVAADRLPVSQFETRLALVRQAPNRASLEAIVADILPTGVYAGAGEPRALAPYAPDDFALAPAEVLRLATFMGSRKRAGSWTVPLRLELRVVMGEIMLDMRDAYFGAELVEIDVHILMGGVKLVIPAGAQVENECMERMSSSSHSTRHAKGAAPINLLFRITGRVTMGSLDVQERWPSADEPDRRPKWMRRLLGGAGGD